VAGHGKPAFPNVVGYQRQVRTSWHWYYQVRQGSRTSSGLNYAADQLSMVPANIMVERDIEAILKAAGGVLSQVVMASVFVQDLERFRPAERGL
jgi:hypothetical protein